MSRKRPAEDLENIESDVEEPEEGELTEDDGEPRKIVEQTKKSKKKKKEKKKRKKRRRRSSGDSDSSSRVKTKAELIAGEDGHSTDREGGSTPDLVPYKDGDSHPEDEGEIQEDSGDRSKSKKSKKKHHKRRDSRSPSREKSYERHREKSNDRSREKSRKSRQETRYPSDNEDDKRRRRKSNEGKSRRRESRSRSRDKPRSAKKSNMFIPPEDEEIYDENSRHQNSFIPAEDEEMQNEISRDEKSTKRRGARSPSGEDNGASQTGNSSGGAISMSIEETNKLRAKLGLKPLNIGSGAKTDGQDPKPSTFDGGTLIPNSDVYHKPAENLFEKSHIEKMRDKLELRRQKRLQEAKLLRVKTLGESESDDDSATNWVKRQKALANQREAAAKRAKILSDLDDEFGVANIVEEETRKEVKTYKGGDLRGLKVEHSSERFREGQSIILTLKDSNVLDEELEDTLVNVNIIDEEKVEKNLKNLREFKSGGYNPYEEEINPVTGDLERKGLLSKYDEEIAGKESKKAFEIGAGGVYNEDEMLRQERERIRQKLKKSMVETLEMPAPRIASDFLTEEESSAKFKKVKKKRPKKKMLKADDLLEQQEDPFRRRRSESPVQMDVDRDVEEVNVANEEQDDLGLQRALARARLIKQRAITEDSAAGRVAEITARLPREEESASGAEFIGTFADDASANKNIILNETSEFCRHLGAWRANEVTGLGETVSRDILEFEDSLKGRIPDAGARRGGWEEVRQRDFDSSDPDSDEDVVEKRRKDSNTAASSMTILDEEPNLARGVAAAIKLASTKGYLETQSKEVKSGYLSHLQAKNYTVDDKMKDDDRSTRRERYNGPTQTFAEKSGYVPNVQIEYVDEHGRNLNAKEAFRHLSHRFHGKGSGKLKTEKRMKKIQEEKMMLKMSSTDTPLQTLEKLRERQKEAATPYIVLTGNKLNPHELRKN